MIFDRTTAVSTNMNNSSTCDLWPYQDQTTAQGTQITFEYLGDKSYTYDISQQEVVGNVNPIAAEKLVEQECRQRVYSRIRAHIGSSPAYPPGNQIPTLR